MIYVIAAVAIASALAAGVGTWRVQDWRYAAKEKDRIEAEAEVRRNNERLGDTGAVKHEQDKERIRTEYVVVTKEVERVVETEFYRGLCLDDAGMRALSRAVSGEPASESAPAVPRPKPAD